MKSRITPSTNYIDSLSSQKSKDAMRSLLNNIVSFYGSEGSHEEFDWSTISYIQVNDLKNYLQHTKKRTPNTINTYLSAIRGVAKEAWKSRAITLDHYLRIKEVGNVSGDRESKGRALSPEELNKMIDYCMEEDGAIGMRDACVIALTYSAGLRREEAALLSLSSYNPYEAKLTILGKGNKERVNPLNNRVIDIIETWLDERGRENGPMFVRIFKNDKVTLKPISDKTIYNIIIRRYKECGLDRLTPHDLRRTFATILLSQGEDVFTVQELMGHNSVDTTKKYDKRGEKQKIVAGKRLPL